MCLGMQSFVKSTLEHCFPVDFLRCWKYDKIVLPNAMTLIHLGCASMALIHVGCVSVVLTHMGCAPVVLIYAVCAFMFSIHVGYASVTLIHMGYTSMTLIQVACVFVSCWYATRELNLFNFVLTNLNLNRATWPGAIWLDCASPGFLWARSLCYWTIRY